MKRAIKREVTRIVRDPRVMMGKPCIRGTRLTVELILERLARHPVEDLLESYPELTTKDVQAALLYAANEMGARTTLETVAADA
jgi:uncharacterized protein (DUF433 family)